MEGVELTFSRVCRAFAAIAVLSALLLPLPERFAWPELSTSLLGSPVDVNGTLWIRLTAAGLAILTFCFFWQRQLSISHISVLCLQLVFACGAKDLQSLAPILVMSLFYPTSTMSTNWRNIVLMLIYALIFLSVIVTICTFVVGYDQYITPGFGMRASGLYRTPNTVYPICMLGCLVFTANAMTQREKIGSLYLAAAILESHGASLNV